MYNHDIGHSFPDHSVTVNVVDFLKIIEGKLSTDVARFVWLSFLLSFHPVWFHFITSATCDESNM